MIKNGKKKKKKKEIKDLYSSFLCPKLLSDHSEELTFVIVRRQFRTSLRIEMACTDLLSCILSFFVIYLTVKWCLTDFNFLFYLFIS